MTEEAARELLVTALALDTQFGRMDDIISSLDEASRLHYAKALGELVGAVNADFVVPITKAFPNLALLDGTL